MARFWNRGAVETRALRPGAQSDPAEDNGNLDVAPGTVGPAEGGGDPHGFELIEIEGPQRLGRRRVLPSPWAGLPDDWQVLWNESGGPGLTDTAWTCLDLNSSIISTMPPYLVGATPDTRADWLENPDPDLYSSWEEFAKQLIWDYQTGEAFVHATAYYDNGWPARFHVVEPWIVKPEMRFGLRTYTIGGRDVTDDILHLRYKSTTSTARGIGPLEVGRSRMVAAAILHQYATNFVRGAVPSTLEVDDELSATEAHDLQNQWLDARAAGWGLPAVCDNGAKWVQHGGNPKDLALVDLSAYTDARIAVMVGVPPFLAGLPSGGDSMTYANVISLFDYHWRAGLRPKVSPVMSGLSRWLLPRPTRLEVNRDAYVQPAPADRATFYQVMVDIGAMTVDQVKAAERLLDADAATLTGGMMR